MTPKENDDYPIFTGVFLVDPAVTNNGPSWKLSKFHITYHFAPGEPVFPQEVVSGDFVKIEHLSIYEDDDILASQVVLHTPYTGRITTQRDGRTPLHITWDSGDKPAIETGKRLTKLINDDDYIDGEYHAMSKVYKNGFFLDDEVQTKKYTHIMNRLGPIGMWYTQCGPNREPE